MSGGQPPLNITFGVELEWVCVYKQECFEFPDPSTGRAGRAIEAAEEITNRLKAKGIAALDSLEAADLRTATGDPTLLYQYWKVHTDDTVGLTSEEKKEVPAKHRTDAMEISSRKLSLTGDNWQAELQKVLDTLQEIEDGGARNITNKNSALHIHVGDSTATIPLRTAKNVCQIITAFTSIFDSMAIATTADRVQTTPEAPHDAVPTYNVSPGWYHRHTPRIPSDRTGNVFDWLKTIEDFTMPSEFENVYDIPDPRFPANVRPIVTGHNGSYNFENLSKPPKGDRTSPLTGTIEFRQHEGTLDFTAIRHWIVFTTSLVSFCHDADDKTMMELLCHSVDPAYRLADLLPRLCKDASVVSYYLQRGNAGTLTETIRTNDHLLPLCRESARPRRLSKTPQRMRAAIVKRQDAGLYGLNDRANSIAVGSLSALQARLFLRYRANLQNVLNRQAARLQAGPVTDEYDN
ncbi:hypothetical protein B0A50_08403 [Salinomyces thailandicus]|uniref:Amidoligase enzyme n=1 Tax=Salinomyces thailandicus TaxID=706561 RepID=A0A4U0TLH2_9PEZI|nr:hypothetical protein B0A50_08403 [Salinomyces thailandica]